LEDVHAELLAWMHKLNAETGVINLAAAEGWAVADLEVKRVLAAHDCMLYYLLLCCDEADQLTQACRCALRSFPKTVDDESRTPVCGRLVTKSLVDEM
jgi:hypothetical protein